MATILEYDNKERAGLYSALPRWTSWKLINRKPSKRHSFSGEPSSRYLYSIAIRGQERLSRLYLDEVRGKIPPGRIAYVVSALLGLTFWWIHKEKGSVINMGKEHLLYITAPFSGPDNFNESKDFVPGQTINFTGCHSSKQFNNAETALKMVEEIGIPIGDGLLRAVLDSPVSGLSRVTDGKAMRKYKEG